MSKFESDQNAIQTSQIANSTRSTSDKYDHFRNNAPDVEQRRDPWWKAVRFAGIPLVYYTVIFTVITIAALTDNLPTIMVVGFAVTMVLAALLVKIGESIPILRDFGLPIILCLVVPAIFVELGWMPTAVIGTIDTFVEEQGFTDFVIIAVIAGAILGMPRKLLISAGIRYIIPVIGTVVLVFLLIGGLGALIGYGFVAAILMVAGPVIAGGLPIGALPMSQMYAQQVGGEPSDFLGGLMSVVILANLICVLAAAILNGLGKRGFSPFVGFNGNGELLRIKRTRREIEPTKKADAANYTHLTQGIIIAGSVFIAGTLLGALVPAMHPYAWATILAAAVKVFNLLPKELEEASSDWGDMVMYAFVPALVTALSTSVIDIEGVINALADPKTVLLTIATVLVAATVSGGLGYMLKFYFVEAAITPGLMMADTGGSGDVAVLSAAERMNLIPFATIATRLGGVLVLFLTSLMVPLLTPAML